MTDLNEFTDDINGDAADYVDQFSEQEIAENAKRINTLKIRARIETASGDPLSLLGTTADGAGMAVIILAEVLTKLSDVTTISQVKQIGADYAPVFEAFLAARKNGEAVMTSDVKGWPVVLQDIQTRNTSVVQVLAGDAVTGGES